MGEFAEDYEETEHLKIYRAYPDRNEFSHKSTFVKKYPSIVFYPRSEDGKKNWVHYKGKITELVMIIAFL